MYKPAQKIAHVLDLHGDRRIDNYFWMKERDSKPVLEYLRQENERTAEGMRPVKDLEGTLYKEMRSRVKENDASVPVFDSGWWYYTRFEQGQEYAIHCRRKGTMDAPEQIILDENSEAKDLAFFDVGSADPSPDHHLLAFAVDTVGRRINTIRFKDLRTGLFLDDKIESVTPDFVWAADSNTLFYVKQDPETLRAFQLYRYQLGKPGSNTLIYEEKDDTYSIELSSARDGNHLYLAIAKRDSAEWRILDAHKPLGEWQVFLPREQMHEYGLEDGGDRVYILTNWQAKNFRIMEAPHSARSKNQWKEVIAHDPKTLREGVAAYRGHFIVNERFNGLTQLRVVDRKSGKHHQVQFEDPAYEVDDVDLPDFDSSYLRYTYESFVQPPSVYDEDFVSHKRELKKEKEVPTYNKDLYETRRIWAKAADGAEVPVSILMKKGTKLDGTHPGLIYGYGSYGLSNTVNFWSPAFSLVDRGFIYAQPHIRGGQEMGRDWYENGRMKYKMNTFTDFIVATEKLMKDGYVSQTRAHMMGGSAGGLLMGAVMNMRPDLYKGVVAAVPFVDVLTTMLDDSIPLTTGEYNEWGNPKKKDEYMYMRQYSPYDNVEAKNYPNLFVQTGYHDSQVQYWEPAKWVAKLRELKTDQNTLLFYTEMDAGHGGASGRFEALKTLAKEFAFILMLEGIKD
jgi:oligopeptidase B